VTKQSIKIPAIYIVSNKKHGTLYTGITSNLPERIYQHKNKVTGGFTAQYNCTTLVYYEVFDDMENAILREKQIKGGSRKKKIALIEKDNPDWNDLYKDIV
jgi:putative endonuclease